MQIINLKIQRIKFKLSFKIKKLTNINNKKKIIFNLHFFLL